MVALYMIVCTCYVFVNEMKQESLYPVETQCLQGFIDVLRKRARQIQR